MSVTTVLLVLAAVVYILGRRLAGQLLELKALFVLPVVLTVIGVTQLDHVHGAVTIGFIAVGLAISVAFGLVRGTTVHLGERGDELWMRYRPVTVVLWIVSLGVKVAMVPVEPSGAGHATTLSIGLGILAESAVVLLRALPRRTRLVWSKGEDGAPHTMSPQVAHVQQLLRQGSLSKDGRVRLADLRRAARRDW